MSKFSLGNGFIARTMDSLQSAQYHEKSMASEEPNYYPQIYMDLETLRAKRKQGTGCFKENALSTLEKHKIKEINAKISRAPLIDKNAKEMKDASIQMYNIDKSCQVTPHCNEIRNKPIAKMENSAVYEKRMLTPFEKNPIDSIEKSREFKPIEITQVNNSMKEPEDLISTCRHNTKCIINTQKVETATKIKERKEVYEYANKPSEETRKSKSHFSKIIAEKNENIELLRGTLLKSVKIIKKLLTELKKYNKTGKIQQEAANFLADEDLSDDQKIDYNEISAFLEGVNQSKLLEANYPLQIQEPKVKDDIPQITVQEYSRKYEEGKSLRKSKKDIVNKSKIVNLHSKCENETPLEEGMLVTFKKGEPISNIEKDNDALEDLLAKTDDSQSIIEGLNEQLGESKNDDSIDK